MADVAHQYNLIGETLRTGIEGLLQGKAAGKALDLQAAQMGVEAEGQRYSRLMKKKEFDLQQRKFDHIKTAYDDARKDPAFQNVQAKAKLQQDLSNKPASDMTLGVDQEWEMRSLLERWMPKITKELNIHRTEDGRYFHIDPETGSKRLLKHGELSSNADIAGIMIGDMDPQIKVRNTLELEQERLAKLTEDAKQEEDDEYSAREIENQTQLVDNLQKQLADMDAKPIKYLNAQISTLADLMTNAQLPEVHLPRFTELSKRREMLVQERLAKAKAAGRAPKTYQQKIYNANGDVIYSKYLDQSVSPNDDPDIQKLMAARTRLGKQSYYDTPSTAKRTDKTVAALVGSMGGSIALMRAYQTEGVEGASEVLRDIQNASAVASGGEVMMRDEIVDNLNKLRGKGIDPFADDFDPNEAVEKLMKEIPENATDEQIRDILGKQWEVLEPFLNQQGG